MKKISWISKISTSGGGKNNTTRVSVTSTLPTSDYTDHLAPLRESLKTALTNNSDTSPYDLSLHDAQGNSTSQNTANCYLVSHAGYYSFPLVYGNARKNGADNTKAYISEKTGSKVLSTLVNRDDKAISSPYICKEYSGDLTAAVLWSEKKGIITKVKVVDADSPEKAKIVFQVPSSTIDLNNAVIALKDATGYIWSWHIWITNSDALKTTSVKNTAGTTYDVANQTLGFHYTKWRETTYKENRTVYAMFKQTGKTSLTAVVPITQRPGSERDGIYTYYQFGRKEAMPGIDTDDLKKDGEGTWSADASWGPHTVGYAISHPELMLRYPESEKDKADNEKKNTDWCITHYNNLWSANNTSDIESKNFDNNIVKTIYDPSPVGFMVPPPDAFSSFTNTTGDTEKDPTHFNVKGVWDNGWDFYTQGWQTGPTLWFPAEGHRDIEDDNPGLIHQNVDVNQGVKNRDLDDYAQGSNWCAIPFNYKDGKCLTYRSNAVLKGDNTNRTEGNAVRCVKEK